MLQVCPAQPGHHYHPSVLGAKGDEKQGKKEGARIVSIEGLLEPGSEHWISLKEITKVPPQDLRSRLTS